MAINCSKVNPVLMGIRIIKLLFNQEMIKGLIEHRIINRLVLDISIQTNRWEIRMENTLLIIWILEQVTEERLMRKLEDEGCFTVLVEGLSRGETEVTIKSLRCVERMLNELDKVDYYLKKYNITELVNRLIYSKKK